MSIADSLFHLLTLPQWHALLRTASIGFAPVEAALGDPASGDATSIDRPLDLAAFQDHKATLPPYAPPSLTEEGFIHLSSREQVCGVANRFYQDQGDLILLEIDPQRLQADLRWEAPVHPDGSPPEPDAPQFPHLYGSLNLDAVIEWYNLPQRDGQFTLPATLLGADGGSLGHFN
ncbi:MAG: DUF952 domain-containing protein [Prochlorothrix sp.]|nr:DUF952 domain-containing protein [Prochlorothrix sp.]